jgi:hypothetical protein
MVSSLSVEVWSTVLRCGVRGSSVALPDDKARKQAGRPRPIHGERTMVIEIYSLPIGY